MSTMKLNRLIKASDHAVDEHLQQPSDLNNLMSLACTINWDNTKQILVQFILIEQGEVTEAHLHANLFVHLSAEE